MISLRDLKCEGLKRSIFHQFLKLLIESSDGTLVEKVVCGLLDVKSRFVSQVRHKNEILKKKIFLRRFPLSRFLVKTLRAKKKLPLKSFHKNLLFGIDVKLSDVRSLNVILTEVL